MRCIKFWIILMCSIGSFILCPFSSPHSSLYTFCPSAISCPLHVAWSSWKDVFRKFGTKFNVYLIEMMSRSQLKVKVTVQGQGLSHRISVCFLNSLQNIHGSLIMFTSISSRQHAKPIFQAHWLNKVCCNWMKARPINSKGRAQD